MRLRFIHGLICEESIDADVLYHGTAVGGLLGIVEEGVIFAGVHWGRENEPHGVRLTRSKEVADRFRNDPEGPGAVFAFDARKLARDFDLVSYEDVLDGEPFDEQEVVVQAEEFPIGDYLLWIEVDRTALREMKETPEEVIQFCDNQYGMERDYTIGAIRKVLRTKMRVAGPGVHESRL